MGKEKGTDRDEWKMGEAPSDGYFAGKEGVIFSLIREACPGDRITFRRSKRGGKRLFKIESPGGRLLLLSFTESFLFSRTGAELKEDILFNLAHLAGGGHSSRAVFGKGCVKIREIS